MKRRHHNNRGTRQIKRGKTQEQVESMAERIIANKPIQHYKNLQEMLDSPEYKEYTRLIRQGVKEGVVDVYPPLPEEETVCTK